MSLIINVVAVFIVFDSLKHSYFQMEGKNRATLLLGFPGGSDGKESTCNVGDLGLIPGLGRYRGGGAWQSTPVFLPRESPWTVKP